MKTYITILTLFALTSCSNFLDRNPKNEANQDDIFTSIEGVESAVNGCYSLMQNQAYYGRNFILFQELYSDNAKPSLRNTGQFTAIYSLQIPSIDDDVEAFWNIAYKIILSCNNILESKDTLLDGTELQKNTLFGEAYGIRALVYYDLVRLFGHAYCVPASSGFENANGKGGTLGVPIVTTSTDENTILDKPRSSVNEVYNQIIKDLTISDSLLSTAANINNRVNQYFTKSLLANIYLDKKDFSTALKYAEDVIYSGEYSLESNKDYINSWRANDSDEIIFQISMTSTDYLATNSIGHMLSPLAYGAVVPTEDLTNLLSKNDVRASFLEKEDENYFIKYSGRNGTLGLDNIPVIRLSELYLIQAECYAERSLLTPSFAFPAQQTLLAIQERADTTVHTNTLTGKELLADIRNEYRKEFAFEGKRFFQIKRILQSISRTDCNASVCELNYPSNNFVFPIPLREIQVNDSLTQNAGY